MQTPKPGVNVIGLACWTTDASGLKRGVVKSQHYNPDYATISYSDSAEKVITWTNVHLTARDAARACEQEADYWRRCSEDVENEAS